MKIAAVTHFKHGHLWQLLTKLGWTCADLSRRSGIYNGTIYLIVSLRKRPSPKTAQAIQNAFGEVGEFFDILEEWPEAFKGFEKPLKVLQYAEIDEETLLAYRDGDRDRLLAQSQNLIPGSMMVEDMLEGLTERESAVITQRFGLGETRPKSLEEIGRCLKIDRQLVNHSEGKALRKMRRQIQNEEARIAKGIYIEKPSAHPRRGFP